MIFDLEPLELQAYGFLYNDFSAFGTNNCAGYMEFDKFADVDAVKKQVLRKTENIGRMRHKLVSYLGIKWLQRLTSEEWIKYEKTFV